MGIDGRRAPTPVLNCLRRVTGPMHERLEQRFDAVSELSDPSRREATIARYATFYSSAHQHLGTALGDVEGLQLSERDLAWRSLRFPAEALDESIPFPRSADHFEALGALYVVDGSALGGRLILNELRKRGGDETGLAFLDPYGKAGGSLWRSLLAVLEREGARGEAELEAICHGAVQGFAHAERVLCGEPH